MKKIFAFLSALCVALPLYAAEPVAVMPMDNPLMDCSEECCTEDDGGVVVTLVDTAHSKVIRPVLCGYAVAVEINENFLFLQPLVGGSKKCLERKKHL